MMDHIHLPHDHEVHSDLDKLKVSLDKTEQFKLSADLFRQLGDTTRIRIFWLLCHCEECVINISAMMEMTSPAISHHLRTLKNTGLISSRREGKEVYYRASDTKESKLLHQIIEQVMEITCPETDR